MCCRLCCRSTAAAVFTRLAAMSNPAGRLLLVMPEYANKVAGNSSRCAALRDSNLRAHIATRCIGNVVKCANGERVLHGQRHEARKKANRPVLRSMRSDLVRTEGQVKRL